MTGHRVTGAGTPGGRRERRAAAALAGVGPQVLRLITDSLRYWVTEMGVDGFRFDLAAALARTGDGTTSTCSPRSSRWSPRTRCCAG
ncbi:hypothetical protein SHIRM173S_02658 [Streptomyces hirsutus]